MSSSGRRYSRARSAARSSRANLGVLGFRHLGAAQTVERAVARSRGQPRTGLVRHAGPGPGFHRRHQRVLRQLLRQPDVTHHAGEAGDDPGRFDAPDRFDGAVGVGGTHGRRYTTLQSVAQAITPRRRRSGLRGELVGQPDGDRRPFAESSGRTARISMSDSPGSDRTAFHPFDGCSSDFTGRSSSRQPAPWFP